MGKHDVPEDPPQSAPEWIVTFSDMISLLVTFFVMLMSFSTIEENEAAIIVGAFGQRTGGILEGGPSSSVTEPPRDRMLATNPLRGGDVPHSRPAEELPENLEEMGQKLGAGELEVDFTAATDGLLLRFGDDCAFEPGSARVPAPLARALDELGEVLQHYSQLVVIEGHASASVTPTTTLPDAEALSTARAAAAARILLDGNDLSRDLLQVNGLGSQPAREGRNAECVEVRVLSLSKARSRALERAREQRLEQER